MLACFIGAKDDGSSGDNWSYKTCKTLVRSSPPTNQHPTFYRLDAPSCGQTNSVKALKGNTTMVETALCDVQQSTFT